MIIEAQCNICHRHIGYASLTGGIIEDGITLVRSVIHEDTHLQLLCDECREGMVEFDGYRQREERREDEQVN